MISRDIAQLSLPIWVSRSDQKKPELVEHDALITIFWTSKDYYDRAHSGAFIYGFE